ncbi:MAG: PA2779 family protein [Deltaproteobacteria bacterium]|nr:PA2779 family protein [Deltaproteobacteria bacterium]
MHFIRRIVKHVSCFLAFAIFLVSVPFNKADAALVKTETVLTMAQGQKSREAVLGFLDRKDVQAAMKAQGINAAEVKARVDSLSDAEVARIVGQIDNSLPAGGDALGTVVGAALFIFVVLLITDILGFTDVFTFVKSQRR